MHFGAWLRSGDGIGWLPAGAIPNSLYRVPSFYLFLACASCYCSFVCVVFVSFSFSCSRRSFVDTPLTFSCMLIRMDIQYIYTSVFIAHDTYQYVTVLMYVQISECLSTG